MKSKETLANNIVFDEGIILKIYKELLKINRKKIKKWEKMAERGGSCL